MVRNCPACGAYVIDDGDGGLPMPCGRMSLEGGTCHDDEPHTSKFDDDEMRTLILVEAGDAEPTGTPIYVTAGAKRKKVGDVVQAAPPPGSDAKGVIFTPFYAGLMGPTKMPSQKSMDAAVAVIMKQYWGEAQNAATTMARQIY